MEAGRELDAAVAKAMGWIKPSERKPPRCDVCGWPLVEEDGRGCWPSNCSMRPHPEPRADRIAPYSTDAAHIPEMLAWVSERRPFDIRIRYRASMRCPAHVVWWPAEQFAGESVIDGDTIQHALARLVVSVAQAEAKP